MCFTVQISRSECTDFCMIVQNEMLAYQAGRAGRKMYKKDWLYSEEAQRIRGRDETCTNGDNLIILPVAMRLGDTPVPIPNTTVKTQAADGTALETMWESRWPPDQKKKTEFTSDQRF